MTRRGIAQVSIVALLVLVLVGLALALRPAEKAEQLVTPARDPFSASIPSTRQDAPYIFGTLPLCLEADGRALLTRVEPVSPEGGLQVVAFAVRPLQPNLLGAEALPLSEADFGSGRVVDELCDEEPGGAELAIELRKRSAGNARTSGVRVNYSIDGRTGTLVIPFTVVLCAGVDQEVLGCRP